MKISIVTGTFNHKESLFKLYTSLLKQKDYIHEWIICDDGSTDGTWEAALRYASEGFLTIHCRAQDNKGMRLARSLNNGFRIASGDLLFVVMGDSYLQEDTLKQLSETYIPGSVGCGVRENVDSKGRLVKYDWRVPDGNKEIKQVDRPEQLTGNSMIVTLKDLRGIHFWDERYEGYGRDDWDVFLQLQQKGLPLYQYNNVRINHLYHGEGQPDNRKNMMLYERRVKGEI